MRFLSVPECKCAFLKEVGVEPTATTNDTAVLWVTRFKRGGTGISFDDG